jgi:hypothetical protein
MMRPVPPSALPRAQQANDYTVADDRDRHPGGYVGCIGCEPACAHDLGERAALNLQEPQCVPSMRPEAKQAAVWRAFYTALLTDSEKTWEEVQGTS